MAKIWLTLSRSVAFQNFHFLFLLALLVYTNILSYIPWSRILRDCIIQMHRIG